MFREVSVEDRVRYVWPVDEQGFARRSIEWASQGTGMEKPRPSLEQGYVRGRSGGPVWPGQKSKGLHHIAEQ